LHQNAHLDFGDLKSKKTAPPRVPLAYHAHIFCACVRAAPPDPKKSYARLGMIMMLS